MESLISVIIPAYNVEPYLEKCVTSVINQRYRNLEIILVDDGSNDRTGTICDELKKSDDRIRVIHQENKGLSAARNSGLDASSGDWIAFLDSDDWIEPDMFLCLLNLALEHNADIASCKTRNCLLNHEPPQCDDTGEIMELSPRQMIRGLRDQRIVRFEVWNKLWRRELIGDTRFKIGQVSEDVYFDRVLFLKANKMVHIEKTFHNYLIQRPGNTLSSFKEARLCIFDEFDALIKDLEDRNDDNTADVVNCIATSFAITIYEQASRMKQGKIMKKRIKEIFEKYYKAAKRSENRSLKGNIGAAMFHISPEVYLLCWKVLFGTR